ncbi:MAG: BREX-3 system phosphatase PglZ [Firmicutes bacterium]|nr:BREX-3 system phosphatase PglZ [Bacillota bacterium]
MIRDVVIGKLNFQSNHFILAFDPDNLLSAEDVVDSINGLGFIIINYEDPEMFRYYYEENIRSILDKGGKLDRKIVIRYTADHTIPYDIQQKCSFVEFSLREIFPKLSYNVIKELYTEVFDRVYIAYRNYNGPILGDKGTKEFVLKNVYGIIPEVIKDFQDLIKTFIPFYYKGEELPNLIANYAVEMLYKNNRLKQFPIRTVVESKGTFLHFLQEQWEEYVKYAAGEDITATIMIEFGNCEIRAYMDNLFQENFLSPVKQLKFYEYPSWMQAGIVYDIGGNVKRRFDSGINKIHTMQQNIKSYKDWFAIAKVWGEILSLKYNHDNNYFLDNRDNIKYKEARRLLNAKFKTWIFNNYGMLSSLSYAKSPVMVHKIPWYINYRMNKENMKRAALIVMDGMSLDN